MRSLPTLLAVTLAVMLLVLTGCVAPAGNPTPQAPTELTVFAAASLADAYRQLGQQFEQTNPGTKVVFNFAGSQQLAAQLGQGAPADVFASANMAQMEVAIEAGRVAPDASRRFVRNQLVVVTAPDSREPITQLQELARPGLKLIFAAEAVPVGRYTLQFLDKASADPTFGADFRDAVLRNVVSNEDNVRAVLTKVSLGEGDAGIVYTSDVRASGDTPVGQVAIPEALNVSADYPIAVINDSQQAALAGQFVEFMFTAEAQAVFAAYGFTAP